MKDAVGLIPQVFYDLIGRVVPGAAILLAALLIFSETGSVQAAVSFVGTHPTIASKPVLFAVALLLSYLLGFLLGAIGFALFESDWKKEAREFRGANPRPLSEDLVESDIPYVYDFIFLRSAAAGGRWAKLRAETHLCRVLSIGSVFLTVGYFIERGLHPLESGFWTALVSLVVIAGACRSLEMHLKVRGWRLAVNCWAILKQEEAQQSAGSVAPHPTLGVLRGGLTEADVRTTPKMEPGIA